MSIIVAGRALLARRAGRALLARRAKLGTLQVGGQNKEAFGMVLKASLVFAELSECLYL